MEKLKRNEQRRLDFLLTKYRYVQPDIIKGWKENSYHKFGTNLIKKVNELLEIHKLFDKLNLSEPERKRIWIITNGEKYLNSLEYKKKPITERKDNKDFINYGTGNSNKSRIRFPKKCRKTAWKRFAKLFPNQVEFENGKIVKKNG